MISRGRLAKVVLAAAAFGLVVAVLKGQSSGLRDVKATLADALGAEAALSKSTVSRVCEAIKTESATWSERSLTDVELDYLFLDGLLFKMHDGARAEPVLAAWGITTQGAPVLIGLAPGATESTDAWGDFLFELVGRGLRPPLLIISDAAPGLLSACEQVFPRSLRQKCLIHRARNLLAKVPAEAQTEIKNAYWQLFGLTADDLAKHPPGPHLVAFAQARISVFASSYEGRFPAAVKCLLTDREQLTSYLRFPVEHHRRIRHSNFIERTFGETRRPVKVIGRLPGGTSCLSLVWAVLGRARRGWRGFTMTSQETRDLQDLRRALLEPPAQLRPARTAAAGLTETVGAIA
jgi:transposase-like protein